MRITEAEIKKRLDSELPGADAQWRLAPLGRSQAIPIDAQKAAVLVPLVLEEDHTSVILIRRTEYIGVHSGQLAFPGGKFDRGEENAYQVALREAREEIGLMEHQCSIVGNLSPLYIPVSGMHVFPVVATLHENLFLQKNEREVEDIYQIPLTNFLDERRLGKFELPGIHRSVPGFKLETGILWGATAMMLSELLEILEPELWSKLSKGNFNNNEQ
ncbi:MAG: NUDIX hydrolase [Bacteroidia bacterium]|jgi:8-oxo-dGTP pyrophosphatase MutT (NUDIX family)